MKKSVVMYFFYTLLIVILVLSYLWQRFQVTKMGYRVSHLESRRAKLGDEKKYLEMEKLNLSSLSRVEKIARERGMILPQKPRVIAIRESEHSHE